MHFDLTTCDFTTFDGVLMTRLRLAVIGVGHLGQHHARILAGMPDVDLVGVVDANAEQARLIAERLNTASYESIDPLLTRVDAVSVVTPTIHHHAVAAEFLKAGVARVLVPVHPAFTAQVLYYQLTGVLWPGADVPWLDPPDPQGDFTLPGDDDQVETELELYKEYMIELVHELNGDDIDKEIDISPDDPDAWMVKVPTTLVWLQPDATLPEFD